MRKAAWMVLAVVLCGGAGLASSVPEREPAASLAELREGNRHYLEGRRRERGGATDARVRLAREGQAPVAAVVACSDSRVPVEELFDQPLGGLFVVRVAGNTADFQAAGSVQYAVEHLNVPLVVVLGHSGCGAVRSALSGERAEGPLGRMLRPVAAAAARARAGCVAGRDLEDAAVRANVLLAVETLRESDPGLARREAEGRARLVGALYDIGTGAVEWLD